MCINKKLKLIDCVEGPHPHQAHPASTPPEGAAHSNYYCNMVKLPTLRHRHGADVAADSAKVPPPLAAAPADSVKQSLQGDRRRNTQHLPQATAAAPSAAPSDAPAAPPAVVHGDAPADVGTTVAAAGVQGLSAIGSAVIILVAIALIVAAAVSLQTVTCIANDKVEASTDMNKALLLPDEQYEQPDSEV
jgi:hypothetical protein